jgi:hypothetical protein
MQPVEREMTGDEADGGALHSCFQCSDWQLFDWRSQRWAGRHLRQGFAIGDTSRSFIGTRLYNERGKSDFDKQIADRQITVEQKN